MYIAFETELVNQIKNLTVENRLKWSYRGRVLVRGKLYDRIKVIDLPKDSVRIELLNNSLSSDSMLRVQYETVGLDTVIPVSSALVQVVYERLLSDVYEDKINVTNNVIKKFIKKY